MSERQIFLIDDGVPLEALLDGARSEGWTLVRRMPRRGDAPPYWEWSTGAREQDRIYLIDHPIFGVRYLQWNGGGRSGERGEGAEIGEGGGGPALPAWTEGLGRRITAAELVAGVRAAAAPPEAVARLCDAIPCLCPTLSADAQGAIVGRLRDPAEVVRWTALKGIEVLDEATLDAVLCALLEGGEVPADIEARAREMRRLVQASIRGELTSDLEEADAAALRRAVAEALSEKKWARVEYAAAKLLWSDKPLRERHAAAAWAAAMAATDRPWKAWSAALVVSELDRLDGREGMAAAVRAEVEPRLASRKGGFTREDLHPALWVLREGWAHDTWPVALDRILAALDERVQGLEVERLMMHVIADSGARRTAEARARAKELAARLPGAITPWTLLAFFHGYDDASDEALADSEALAAALDRRERAARGEADPPTPEEASFDAWADGILAEQARRPDDLLRCHVRICQLRGDLEGALAAAEREVKAQGSSVAWMDKGTILTGLKRHREAIDAYDRAIALAGRDGRITLGDRHDQVWFNRACERAITGDAEGALADLAEAVRRDRKWVDLARSDDYFESIRSDPRFEEVLTRKPDEGGGEDDFDDEDEYEGDEGAEDEENDGDEDAEDEEEDGGAEDEAAREGPPPWEVDPFGNPYDSRDFYRRIA